MTPATEKLKPLPSIFPTFESFIEGTMTGAQAAEYCKNNPTFEAYGLRKLDPATGEGVSRYAVRPIGALVADGRRPEAFETVETTRQIMNRIKASAPASAVETRNGVKRPRGTTVGAQVWAMCDDLMAKKGVGVPFTKFELETESMVRGFKLSNVMTECSLWRRFNGYTWKVK